MRAMTGRRPRIPTSLLLSVIVGAAFGLVFGLGIRAAQGYDCGPLPGLDSTIATLIVIGIGAVFLVAAVIAAAFRRLDVAAALVAAVIAAAAGVPVGLVVGTPVDSCPRPTSEYEPAVLTLRLAEPYSVEFRGPGRCERDIASQRVLSVRIESEGPQPHYWLIDGLSVDEIDEGYGPAQPGLQIGLRDTATNASVVYRQSANSQVTQTVDASSRTGTLTFIDLPRDGAAVGGLPDAPELSGSLDWRCPDSSLSP